MPRPGADEWQDVSEYIAFGFTPQPLGGHRRLVCVSVLRTQLRDSLLWNPLSMPQMLGPSVLAGKLPMPTYPDTPARCSFFRPSNSPENGSFPLSGVSYRMVAPGVGGAQKLRAGIWLLDMAAESIPHRRKQLVGEFGLAL